MVLSCRKLATVFVLVALVCDQSLSLPTETTTTTTTTQPEQCQLAMEEEFSKLFSNVGVGGTRGFRPGADPMALQTRVRAACPGKFDSNATTTTTTTTTNTTTKDWAHSLLLLISSKFPGVDALLLRDVALAGVSRFVQDLASHNAKEKSSQFLGEQIHLQTTTPFTQFMSPKQWWVRADVIAQSRDMCVIGHVVSYSVSWIAFGWFLTCMRAVLDVGGVRNLKLTQDLKFSAFFSVLLSFAYAMVVLTCLPKEKVDECGPLSRVRFNFLWPPLIHMVYAFLISFKRGTHVSPKLDAFVYNTELSKKHSLESWEEGAVIARGGMKAGEVDMMDGLANRAPLVPPSTFDDLVPTFKLSTLIFVFMFASWLRTCPDE